jgi:GNAT superfamily N-acetyltransferase
VAHRNEEWTIEEWEPDRAPDLTELVALALPHEDLTHDELLMVCWDDPGPDRPPGEAGVVLGTPRSVGSHDTARGEPEGAVVVLVRAWGTPPDQVKIGFVKLIAVHPAARRRGLGHALLAAAEQWAWAQGAIELQLSGSAPFYLWPGVDATNTDMLALAEARGYQSTGSDVNMALPTTFRADPPEGVVVRRVITDDDVACVRTLVEAHWPEWWAETERAIESGCCHAAFVESEPSRAIGFCCHSVNRAGWLGPMGTDPERRTGGVGSALVGQVCRDLMIAEFEHTEISWVGPIRFYGKQGATVSRVFRQYRKRRPQT